MDSGAVTILRTTFLIFANISDILKRLLQRSEMLVGDLESQTLDTQVIDGERSSHLERPVDLSQRIENNTYQRLGISSSTEPDNERKWSSEDPPLAEGQAQVFLHNDGAQNGHLALAVNQEMVSVIQQVAKSCQDLSKYEKRYAILVDKVCIAERSVDAAKANIGSIQTEEAAQELQMTIDQEEYDLQQAVEQRETMADRLEIFKMNLRFAQKESQAFFAKIFLGAGLLETPNTESEGTTPDSNGDTSLSPGSDTSEASVLDQEELSRQAAYEGLLRQSQELRETREQFEEWPLICDQQRDIYKQHVAEGISVPPESERDVQLLQHSMLLTGDIIEAERSYERALAQAKAVGVISEHWGDRIYYDDAFDPQSIADEEQMAYQKSRDWSRVEVWRQAVSCAIEASDSEVWEIDRSPNTGDSANSGYTEVESWEMKSAGIEDSLSVVAHDEYQSKNLKQWHEMIGHR